MLKVTYFIRQRMFFVVIALGFLIGLIVHYYLQSALVTSEKKYERLQHDYQIFSMRDSTVVSGSAEILSQWRDHIKNIVMPFIKLSLVSSQSTCLSHYAQDEAGVMLAGDTQSAYDLSTYLQKLQKQSLYSVIKLDELSNRKLSGVFEFKIHTEIMNDGNADD